MKINDLFLMAVRNLTSRKLRTFLTILGVIIGTTAIIVMLSLGIGMTESMMDTYRSMGNLTDVYVSPGYNQMTGKQLPLDDKLVKTLKEIPNVKAVNATLSEYVTFKVGQLQGDINLVGVDPTIMEDLGMEVERGRLLNNNDEMNIVFGSGAKDSFHNPKRRSYGPPKETDVMKGSMEFALGSESMQSFGGGGYGISMESASKDAKYYPVKVVGELKLSDDRDSAYSAFINIKHMKKLLNDIEAKKPAEQQNKDKTKYYSNITIKVDEMEHASTVTKTVEEMGYYAFSMTSMIEQAQEGMIVFQAIFGGIGAISLLVAAIGITNTMIMSIYERTREIGVMKVIGASIKDIQRLFLVEASFIGLLGGIFGVLLSYAFSFGLNSLLGPAMGMSMGMGGGMETKISIIPPWLVLLALVFSASIGLLSGYFPARRAMKLSALDAIRTE